MLKKFKLYKITIKKFQNTEIQIFVWLKYALYYYKSLYIKIKAHYSI